MRQLSKQKLIDDKVNQVMSTATEFKTKQYYKGDKAFSFDTVGKIKNGAKLESKYMLDEAQF